MDNVIEDRAGEDKELGECDRCKNDEHSWTVVRGRNVECSCCFELGVVVNK